MNLGQILEGIVSKSVMYCDKYIREKPEITTELIKWLNNSVIKYVDFDYHNRIKENIIKKLETDLDFKEKFINNVIESNLFVEAPCFAEIDIKNLINSSSVSYKEPVLLKKELIEYMKQNLKIETSFPSQDITLKNIFCAPIYIQKLYKMASKIMTARDLGVVKAITKQPLKGRARGGGSKIGYYNKWPFSSVMMNYYSSNSVNIQK